ncbi:MAG: prepilin peptidase [Deltaproteobacteria bacterium]|jgi:leader peptidase (prepilin peptidase)/N-methyltransferase|nr:prepilin peptidase [Deltaproteobacteria bacterium]
MELTGVLLVIATVVVTALGLVIGSFLNVVIYRLPREGLAVSKPSRSFCPACQNQIAWYDNIPVLSWVILRGHCRSCRVPISIRYPLVELLSGLLSFFIFQAEGLSLRYVFYFYFAMCLTAIAFIDLEFMVIPDVLVKPTYLVGFISAIASPHPSLPGATLWGYLYQSGWNERLISLAGAALAFLVGFLTLWLLSTVYKLLKGHRGLGEGDPPLLGLIALFLGLPSILPVLLLSSVLGLLSVVILVISGRFPKSGLGLRPIPFGPFLSLAALIWLFWGQRFLLWYLPPTYYG